MRPRVRVAHIRGALGYAEASLLQTSLVNGLRAGRAPDTLLLLEHPPVFTLGRLQESAANVLASQAKIDAVGASVIQSDRGGNVTFHGPGQLVAYPILDLRNHKQNLRWYVSALEEAMIGTAAAYGVEAVAGGDGQTGVWAGDRKLGAIGVRVARWYSTHGIALNANVDLGFFDMIVPCGLHETPQVTSLTRETGRTVTVDETVPKFCDAFAAALGCELYEASVEEEVQEAIGAAKAQASNAG